MSSYLASEEEGKSRWRTEGTGRGSGMRSIWQAFRAFSMNALLTSIRRTKAKLRVAIVILQKEHMVTDREVRLEGYRKQI